MSNPQYLLKMNRFEYDPLPGRVLFGAGCLGEIKNEVERLGGTRALILCTPNPRPMVLKTAALLGERCVGIFDKAVMHVPYESVATTLQHIKNVDADLLIPIGGGSAIGLAKGVALKTGLPILAVPSTYSGSEVTHIWGITKDGRKTTGRDPVVKPRTVLYDPELTTTLPPAFSATSGINAMAHAVEALYAERTTPIASIMAESAIRTIATGLPKIIDAPKNLEARSAVLYGAWLSGMVLGQVGMALHHKLAHVLGGTFNLPHAKVHTVMLPYATAYNADHAPEAMMAIGRALGVDATDAAGGLFDLNKSLNTPLSLRELGLVQEQLNEAALLATQSPYYNPRPVTEDGILALLSFAYEGIRPQSGLCV